MHIFEYKGVTYRGKKVKGKFRAIDEHQAKNIIPSLAELVSFEDLGEELKIPFLSNIKKMDKAVLAAFLEQIQSMLDVGYTFYEMFTMMARYGTETVKHLSVLFSYEISRGKGLDEAFFKYRKEIGRDLSGQIKVGIASAKLGEVLKATSKQLREEKEMDSKIQKALINPIFTLIIIAIAALVMFFFAAPTLAEFFDEMGVPMTADMVFILSAGEVIKANWQMSLFIFFSIIAISYFLIKYPLAVQWAYLVNRMPVVGEICRGRDTINFYRSLGYSIQADRSAEEGLSLAAGTVKNKAFQRELKIALEYKVKKAAKLSDTLAMCQFFEEIDLQTISIGERTGILGEQLLRLARSHETRLNIMTDTINEYLQPIILAIMGLLVGVLGMSTMRAIYGSLASI